MKNLKYILILALLTAWLSPNVARAATWRVCADCPVSSLRAAIRQAAPCDTIVVDGGVWADTTIVIDKSIVLLGVNDPVIDGQGGKHELMLIAAHQVEVAGFTFRNMGVNFLEDVAALRAEGVREVHIHHNRFENTFFAIYLAHVRGGEIANNVIRGQAVEENNSGNAIHAWYCSDLRIHDNDVAGHRDGIYFEFVDHSRIADNHSHDNLRYGLHFMFSDDDVYYRNTFERNGAGVAVMFSRRIDMWHNVFRHNWGGASFGLLLKEIYDAEIRDNHFEKNTIGIFVEGSNRITYTRNRFERNGWAVKMNGGCLDNAFTHNAFLHNTFDLATQIDNETNTYDENYWSEYAGYDLDRDGFGDVPHRPVKLFAWVVQETPEAVVLLRSLFVDLLNFSEKVSPVLTPATVQDHRPLMWPGT